MHANANTCKDYRFNVPLICSDVYWRCRFQSPTDLLFRFVSSEPPAMCAHWWLITQHMKESGDALWHPRIAEQPAGNWSLLVRPLRAGGLDASCLALFCEISQVSAAFSLCRQDCGGAKVASISSFCPFKTHTHTNYKMQVYIGLYRVYVWT